MVNPNAEVFPLAPAPIELPEEELRWCSVRLQEVKQRESRLKAAVFDIEGRHAREVVEACKWPIAKVAGNYGLAAAWYPGRFKRHRVEYSDYPIYQPGQITELNPKPAGYLSPLTRTDIENLRAKHGQILMTRSGRSGSIGRTAYVSRTMNGKIISDDVIRIECSEADTAGYLYAFLSTKTGRALVKSNEYGAMIPHIEPSHLEAVPVPNPPPILKKQIHDIIIHSYALRDESNALLEEAESLLYDVLKLPPLSKLRPQAFDQSAGLLSYTVNLSRLAGRLDASYHVPIIDAIMRRLKKEAAEITTFGDPRISERIFLGNRFARVYVQEGQGAVYFTGKHMLELDPEAKRHLAFSKHAKRIQNQLLIKENMLLISCSGNLGKVVLCPEHWEGWVMTHDIIRLVPTSHDIAGFLAVYLNTDYGQELIRRNSYGSVVPHIDDNHITQMPIPLLKDSSVQAEINRLALEANAKRTEAYHAEQKAIRITNDEVIHAQG